MNSWTIVQSGPLCRGGAISATYLPSSSEIHVIEVNSTQKTLAANLHHQRTKEHPLTEADYASSGNKHTKAHCCGFDCGAHGK